MKRSYATSGLLYLLQEVRQPATELTAGQDAEETLLYLFLRYALFVRHTGEVTAWYH